MAVALTAASCLWLVVVFSAPVAASRNRLPFLALAGYQSGSLVCHQRPERSFRIAGVHMPVCARCLGLYAAGSTGALIAWFRRRPRVAPSRAAARTLFGAAAAPIVLSLGLEWSGVTDSSNVVRLLTGLPLGLAAGWILVSSLIAEGQGGQGDAL
jgi:uncharacterized membrane protein